MEFKSLEISWIFETDLTNMNAGEGSSNLKEIKTYKNGLPYISGQSMRHALREAMKRENKDAFKCTPEYPCGDIENCWTCDLFGYLLPGDGAKRWSPIKAAPALGQIREPITTDLIFRMVEDIKCPECGERIYPLAAREKDQKEIKKETPLTCPKCEKSFEAPYDIRQALAYKQLIKNIYKTNLSIDIANIGVEEVPKINDDGKLDGVEDLVGLADEERLKRVKAIVNATYNLSDFANQSREMVNASPDFVVLGLQRKYNHRLASVLKLDKDGNVDTEHLESVINDLLEMEGTKIFVGLIKGVVNNEDDLIKSLNKLNEEDNFKYCDGPKDAFNNVITCLSGDKNESS